MKPIEKKCFLCPQNKFGKCLLESVGALYKHWEKAVFDLYIRKSACIEHIMTQR